MPRDKSIPPASNFEWESAEEKARVLAGKPAGMSLSNYFRSMMGLPLLEMGRRKITVDEAREKLKDPTLSHMQRNYFRAIVRGVCVQCDAPPVEGHRYCADCGQKRKLYGLREYVTTTTCTD